LNHALVRALLFGTRETMNLKLSLTIVTLTIPMAIFAGAAERASAALTQKSLEPAVAKYLQEKGNFCLGKFNWPIDVSEQDRQQGTNDAIQMPVLEKLGLVVSSAVVGDSTVKQYDLTEQGKKYYLVKKTVTLGPGDEPVDHPGDFCAARLKLERVVGWQPPEVVDGRTQVTVKYTYKVAAAADWTHDPEIKRVFPMIHRIVDGEGTMQLTQLFAWSNQTWVAVTPGDGAAKGRAR
jgi:hypothetical protein